VRSFSISIIARARRWITGGPFSFLSIETVWLRGGAFFFGVFALANAVRALAYGVADESIWALDLRLLGSIGARIFVVWTGALLLVFALRACGPALHRLVRLTLWFCLVIAAENTLRYYVGLLRGQFSAAVPVPVTLVLAVLAGIAYVRITRERAALRPPYAATLLVAAPAFLFGFLFLQMCAYGGTDYRRSAHLAIVFGARAYADGRMSTALYDRIRTATDLYLEGRTPVLFLSGGPGEGPFSEAELMRRYARSRGVPASALVVDDAGLSTIETARNAAEYMRSRGMTRALAVSQFYHLPRVKLTLDRAGIRGFTVPAAKSRLILKLPVLMLREAPALIYYYLRPPQFASDIEH
jgi:uncharacterized SAM-binding protein YcdF (DUF218 family)